MAKRIKREMPPKGSTYKKTYKGKRYVLKVDVVDSQTVFKIGSRSYASPSGAAKSINGNTEVNGWKFWGMV